MWWLPKFKYVNLTGTGADIVAAVSGKKIRVLSMFVDELDGTADVILTVKTSNSGATKTLISGFDLGEKTLPFSRVGWFETVAGESLYGLVAGTTPNLNISVVYVEVT